MSTNLRTHREASGPKRLILYKPRILSVDGLVEFLEDNGFRVIEIQDPDKLSAAITESMPRAVLFPYTSDCDAFNEVVDVRGRTGPFPMVCLSEMADIRSRMAMMRSGVDAYVTLPFDRAHLLAKLDEIMELNRKRQYVVTIVDDDRDYSDLTRLRLTKAGFKVNLVNEPDKLLDSLAEEKPDVILMDLYLPEYGGEELTKMLRQNIEYEDIPIIYLSAETDHEKQLKAINFGGDEFITKPFKNEYLVKTIVDRIRRSIREKSRIRVLGKSRSEAPVSGKYELFNRIRECEKDCKGSLIYVEVREISGQDRHHYIFYIDDVMRRLMERVEEVEDTVFHARLSDSAIGILSHAETEKDLMEYLDRLIDSLGRSMQVQGKTVRAAMATGATLISSADDYHDILVDAHRACDFAWSRKEKYHVYMTRQDSQIVHVNTEWEARIRKALDNDGLLLYFQPIVTIHGVHEEMYDVMVRLKDEDNMIFEAQRFIPVAEQIGMIRQIDKWVMQQAMRMLRGKRRHSPETRFFIKVSAESLASSQYVDTLLETMKKAGLPPSSIVIEFRQKDVSRNIGRLKDNLDRISASGIQLAIEHFGADLSSYDLLEILSVSFVKIDGAFTSNMATSQANLSTVKSIAEMAGNKGVQSIATYVESADCLALLWNSGVAYTQGNFLSQPDASLDFEFSATV